MKSLTSLVVSLGVVLALSVVAWLLGLGEPLRAGLATGHLWDWAAAIGCLLWLWAVLKWPWDLYFRTKEVAFELTRSVERGVAVTPGRKEELAKLQRRLLWVALGSHVVSAALLAGITYLTNGKLGYLFAVGYLGSSGIRPLVSAYGHLMRRLRDLNEELRYPREDIREMRERLQTMEQTLESERQQHVETRRGLDEECKLRDDQTRQLRLTLETLGREFEQAVSRVGDNQDVVRGLQALSRLVAQAAR
jgi:DNA repair exonuclease SbcCD ATPase subunit